VENPLLVLVTVSSQKEGERIGQKLVEEKLAACVNIVPHLYSIYCWKGNIEQEGELLLLIKTMPDRLDKLIEKVKKIHSYDVPEILAIPTVQGNSDYINWINESTRSDE
jgi:periplasmic divalent cation tolerance protein